MASELFHFRCDNFEHSRFSTMVEMRQSGELCDVIIEVGGVCITAHRLVLASAIPYFRIMFRNNLKECKSKVITMKDVDPDVVECLIDFAYTNNLSIPTEKVPSLFQVSAFWLLDSVREACLSFFGQRIESSNALSIREWAGMYDNVQVTNIADFYIRQNFEHVCRSEEFLDLPFPCLKQLIRKDDLNIVSESIMFESVMKWVKACEQERTANLPELLRHVRLHLLTPDYLSSQVSKEVLVHSSTACKLIVEEAKKFRFLGTDDPVPCSFQAPERYFEKSHHMKCAKLMGYVMFSAFRSASGEVRVKYYDHIKKRWTVLCDIERSFPSYIVCTEDRIIFIKKSMAQILHLESRKQIATRISGRIPSCAGVIFYHNQLYFFGGNSTSSNIINALDIENLRCREVGTIRIKRAYPGVVSVQDDVYVVGGRGDETILNSVERYNPIVGQGPDVSSMLIGRMGPGCATIGNRIYVCGGETDNGATTSAEIYDPLTDQWTAICNMRVPKRLLSLVPYANKLYAMDNDAQTETGNGFRLEIYHLTDDEWQCEDLVLFSPLTLNENHSGVLFLTNTASRF